MRAQPTKPLQAPKRTACATSDPISGRQVVELLLALEKAPLPNMGRDHSRGLSIELPTSPAPLLPEHLTDGPSESISMVRVNTGIMAPVESGGAAQRWRGSELAESGWGGVEQIKGCQELPVQGEQDFWGWRRL